MNPVYIRMAFYVIAPIIALAPGVTFDPDAFTVLIDLERAAVGLSVGVAGIAAVFRKWGKS